MKKAYSWFGSVSRVSFSTVTLLVGWQEVYPAPKYNLCNLSAKVLFSNKWRKKTDWEPANPRLCRKWRLKDAGNEHNSYNIDWLNCGFTSHLTQNRSFQRCSPSQSLGMVWKKLNLTQQKHTFTNQKNVQQKINTKKLKPGLVASYDIWHGNWEGLFWFRCFINLSLIYLFRHLPTYLQPQDPHGAIPATEPTGL